MSERWLRDQLTRYTYRPGWSLAIEAGTYGFGYLDSHNVRLVVRYDAPDSRDPERVIPLVVSVNIPDMQDDADRFASWLARAMMDIEWHESREWLRRDGAIYDDPHVPLRPAPSLGGRP